MTWGGDDGVDEVDDGTRYTPADDFMFSCDSRTVAVLANSSYFSGLGCTAYGFEDFSSNVTFSCSGTWVSNCQFDPNPINPGAITSMTRCFCLCEAWEARLRGGGRMPCMAR